jgi:hypothetical protein
MDRDFEVLALRATRVIFGVFGHLDDVSGNRTARVGGSGIIGAPFQALTARHVCRDLFRTDPGRFDDLDRRNRGYFALPHSALFQVVDVRDMRSVIWSVTRTWDPVFNDICFMEVALDDLASSEKQVEMPTRFFEWSLEPPPPGEQVVMLGFPGTEITISGDRWNIKCQCVSQRGQVADVYSEKRDAACILFLALQSISRSIPVSVVGQSYGDCVES